MIQDKKIMVAFLNHYCILTIDGEHQKVTATWYPSNKAVHGNTPQLVVLDDLTEIKEPK